MEISNVGDIYLKNDIFGHKWFAQINYKSGKFRSTEEEYVREQWTIKYCLPGPTLKPTKAAICFFPPKCSVTGNTDVC